MWLPVSVPQSTVTEILVYQLEVYIAKNVLEQCFNSNTIVATVAHA